MRISNRYEEAPMKTKEELNALKEEVETLIKKLAELSEDELKQVSGGGSMKQKILPQNLDIEAAAYAAPTADEIIEELRS